MKNKTALTQIVEMEATLKEDIERWNHIREHGCDDPFWPDGVNLNLVRNHIIYDLKELAKLDKSERQISMFDTGGGYDIEDVMKDKRVPPKVEDDLMIHDRFENGRRVKVCMEPVTTT